MLLFPPFNYLIAKVECSIVIEGLDTRPIACRDSAGPATYLSDSMAAWQLVVVRLVSLKSRVIPTNLNLRSGRMEMLKIRISLFFQPKSL